MKSFAPFALFLASIIIVSPLSHAADPTIDIVMVVDNSGSNTTTDPNRLRGIAAELVLDALVLLGANPQVGIVFFATSVSGDDALGAEANARKKLRTQLEENGATNMEGGLNQGLKLLQSSSATQKIIVMLTDGMPDPRGRGDEGQIESIKNNVIPLAVDKGIKVFALGLSEFVNQPFLELITTPTGGRAIIAKNAQEMLKLSKQLVNGFDNVHRLKDSALPSGTFDLPFNLPAGVERLRVTAVLEQPGRFSAEQIKFEVNGCPTPDSEQLYTTTKASKDGSETVVAWSAFLTTTGQSQKCQLHLQIDNPDGNKAHGGVQIIIEGRTDLKSLLACRPDQNRLTFGTEVICEIAISNNAGPINPTLPRNSGRLLTQGSGGSAGSVAVQVNGAEVRFKVPEAAGRQTVRVESKVDPAIPAVIAEYSYQAIPLQPGQLLGNPKSINFELVGPDQLESPRTVEIWTEFSNGDPRTVQISPQVLTPLKDVITLSVEGRPVKAGGTQTLSLPRGKRLTLELKVSMKNANGQFFHIEDGRYDGTLIFKSDAVEASLEIPFQLEIRKPKLLLTARQNIGAYWRPDHAFNFVLADAATDGKVEDQLSIEPVEQQVFDKNGIALGKLALIPQGKDAPGRYPITRSGYTLQAAYTPAVTATTATHGPHEITFSAKSSFGAEQPLVTHFWTLPVWWDGWSLLGPLSPHLQHLLLWFLVGGGLMLTVMAVSRRVLLLNRWRAFRPGQQLDAQEGDFGAGADHNGLALLNDPQYRLADTVFGRFQFQRNRLLLIPRPSAAGVLTVNERPLAGTTEIRPGDVVAIHADGADQPAWEHEYLGPDGQGGSFQILRNPLGLGINQVIRTVVITVIVLWALRQALMSDWLAALAGRSSVIEGLYVFFSSWWY